MMSYATESIFEYLHVPLQCQEAYLDVDMEGLLVHAASSQLIQLAGKSLRDVFPSPHTSLLLQLGPIIDDKGLRGRHQPSPNLWLLSQAKLACGSEIFPGFLGPSSDFQGWVDGRGRVGK